MMRWLMALATCGALGAAQAISLAAPDAAPHPGVDAKSSVVKGAVAADVTDLWWNASESGWGMQVIQNHLTLFATIYTYDAGGQPTFFVGVLTSVNGTDFGGQLYASTGTYYGSAWNPGAASETLVGTISIALATPQSMSLSYTVNGVAVSKPGLTRLPLQNDDFTGLYSGIANQTQVCSSTLPSGTYNNRGIVFTINHGGDATLNAQILTGIASCSYTGDYVQEGRFGRSTGTFTCDNGEAGSFGFHELQRYAGGIVGRYTATSNFCQVSGVTTATKQ